MGRKSLPLGGGLAVAGGQLRVVGGVINPMRVWELSISVINEVGAFVLPGFTAKCRDVEKTPEMRDSDQKNWGRKVAEFVTAFLIGKTKILPGKRRQNISPSS